MSSSKRIAPRSAYGIVLVLAACALVDSSYGQQPPQDTKQFSPLELTALRHFSGWQFGMPNEKQLRLLRCASRLLDTSNKSLALNQLTANVGTNALCGSSSALLDAQAAFRLNIQRTFEDAESQNQLFVYEGKRTDAESEVVALGFAGGKVTCSGVALSKRIVLTAAHCTCDPFGPPSAIYYDSVVSANSAYIGADPHPHRLGGASCPSDKTKFEGVDLAIVVAVSDIPTNLFARPASATEEASAATVAIFGYGKTSDLSGLGARTFAAGVAIASRECTDTLALDSQHPGNTAQSRYLCVPMKEFVAGSPWGNKPDSCGGDSGGPALIRTAQPSSDAVVMGVVSRGIRNGACGDGGIYELLSGDVLSWIGGFVPGTQAGS